MKKYVIGVDGGTESLRAGVFDIQGTLLASASCPYDTQFPQPGWAEQRPEDWWQALGKAVPEAVKAAGIQPCDVASICLDTTCCTVVALDKGVAQSADAPGPLTIRCGLETPDGTALRPALLWMDMRSAAQAAEVARCGDAALKVNAAGAGPVSAEWMVPKSLWLKQHEPDVWAKAATICEFQDFMNYHLTGRMCASVNCASVRWHYSTESGWPLSMLHKLGIPELAAKWPQELLPLGATVGHCTAAAAAHLGLLQGTPVAQGGADAFIGILGLGVVQPGQMALLTGSSHLQLGLVDREVHGPGIFGTYRDAVLPGLHVIEGGQTSTGSIVNWFKNHLVAPGVSYDTLDAEAEAVPPGCEGLACLDHFQGNRTPHTDPLSRGALVGLTLKHGRGHIFRSLMEGVAFGTRLILDTMGARGYRPESIVIAGGAVRSPCWLQIHADVCNVPFVLTQCCEAPMLGCAVLAAARAGLYPDITTAAAAMVKVDSIIQPNPKVHEQYESHYQRYLQLYPALKDTFHNTAAAARPGSDSTAATAVAAAAAAAPATGSQDCDGAGEEASAAPTSAGTLPESGAPATSLRGIVSASILAADFSSLGAEVRAALSAGASWIHVDMFDGTLVDNFTFGPPVLRSLAALCPTAFFDCHLAVKDPARYVARVAAAGASQMTFHAEALGGDLVEMSKVAAAIRATGMRAGVAVAPETPGAVIAPLVQTEAVDLVLCMTVAPGFGGQKMIPEVLEKVRQLRSMFPKLDIQVDGGITAETATHAVDAGANILVAGSALFVPILPGAARDSELLKAAVGLLHLPLAQRGYLVGN